MTAAALPLATVSDLEAALGRDLDETEKRRAEFVLDKLSAAFRERARQTFTVEQYTHRLKVDGGGRLFPTRTPLIAVHSVTTDDGTPVAWQLRHGFVQVDMPASDFLVATYSAGLAEVPAAVRLQLADSARPASCRSTPPPRTELRRPRTRQARSPRHGSTPAGQSEAKPSSPPTTRRSRTRSGRVAPAMCG